MTKREAGILLIGLGIGLILGIRLGITLGIGSFLVTLPSFLILVGIILLLQRRRGQPAAGGS